jgi:hypothetical protein
MRKDLNALLTCRQIYHATHTLAYRNVILKFLQPPLANYYDACQKFNAYLKSLFTTFSSTSGLLGSVITTT